MQSLTNHGLIVNNDNQVKIKYTGHISQKSQAIRSVLGLKTVIILKGHKVWVRYLEVSLSLKHPGQ